MWTQLDSDVSEGQRFDLYERHGRYMIRVDGWELMNGEQHASEDALGRLAALIRPGAPRVLVAGLGLGCTLAALLAERGDRSGVTIVERSRAVLRWFSRTINPPLAASGVHLAHGDVLDWLEIGACWDVIVLDVDNGPAALSSPGNASLYAAAGLASLHRSLTATGHVLLWSGFEDAAFAARAVGAGFSVTRRAVPFPNRFDEHHTLYVLSRRALPPAALARLGLIA